MSRPIRARIDLHALEHNLGRVRRLAAGKRVVAVIKANAYGHGLLDVARALHEADAFGVASLDEAEQLRHSGIATPILLLEGFFTAAELPQISHHHLEIVVHNERQLRLLESGRLKRPLRVWLKIDTGMNRLGFTPDRASEVYQRLARCRSVAPGIRLMTHLCCADEPERATTATQLERFRAASAGLDGETSIANSAGIVAWAASHGDWVRPGIMLYGASPMRDGHGADLDLVPVMTLESELIAVRDCRRGDTVGYGADWIAAGDTRIGVIAAGYGDGYPRHAVAGTPILVNGRHVELVGRVSMDMLTVDLSPVPDAEIGDSVVLWGEGLPAEDVARHAGTIAYELFCQVTDRVPRIAQLRSGD